MGSRYEVEVTITSAKDLKNINWRHGPLKPYAVVWIDPKSKCSTKVDEEGDSCPYWDQTLVIPFNTPIEDSTLYIDVVHAKAEEDTKPLIGSAKLKLTDVIDDVGMGESSIRKLDLKRPSGRPHGKLEVKVIVSEPRYRAPDPYYAPPYGVPRHGSRDYYAAPPPPPFGNSYAAPPSGYPYNATPYAQPGYAQPGYGQQGYGQPGYGQVGYGEGSYGQPYKEEKKSKYGMGTGLAVGAAAGLLGGLAIAEGVDYVEDQIADDVADKVEDDLAADGDFDGGDF